MLSKHFLNQTHLNLWNIKEEEEEGEIKQEEDEIKEKEQKDQDNIKEQENQSNVEEQGDEETKEEVVENGEAKEEGELSDNSDAPSLSKAPLKTEVTPTEELDVLFAREPFVKAATMFSQNNFDTVLGQLTAAIEEGNLSVNLYLYCFSWPLFSKVIQYFDLTLSCYEGHSDTCGGCTREHWTIYSV